MPNLKLQKLLYYAQGQLDEADDFQWSDIDPDTTRFLMKVWNTYGSIAAWRLRNMTHEEAPWRDPNPSAAS